MEKRTIYAVVFALLLGVGAFLTMRQPDKGEHRGAAARPVPVIKTEEITKIEITSQKDEKTTFEKSGDGWHITAPQSWPVDTNAFTTLTTAIGKLTFADVVAESPAKHKDLGVDDLGSAKIRITTPGGVADLILGNTVGGYQMIRVAGKNEVWQANNLFTYQINKPPKDWRDHVIALLAISEVDHVEVVSGANKVVLDRNADKKSWKLVDTAGDGPKPGERLDDSQGATVAQAIGSLRADDFADGKSPKDAGLEPPDVVVTVTAKGKATGIEIGGTDGEDRYVRVVGQPTIYKVKKYLVEHLAYKPIDYRDKTLLAVKDAQKIAIVNGKTTTTVVKKGDAWSLQPDAPLDTQKIQAMAGGVEQLAGSSIVTDKTIKTGLDKPHATITVTPKSGPAEVVQVGNLTEGNTDYYVTRAGTHEVMLVKKFAIDRLLKTPADLAPPPPGAAPPHGMPPGRMPPGMMMPPGMPH